MREMKFKPYLLGTASEAERSEIDYQVLTDEQVYTDVLLAEDDLIEAYLQHELTTTERTQFERFFLADPERQHRLQLAQSLYRYAASKSKPATVKPTLADLVRDFWQAALRRPLWQWALACGLLAALTFGLQKTFIVRPADLLVQSSPSPLTTPTVITGTETRSLQLLPGQVRAAGRTDGIITLSPKVATVQLELRLPGQSYAEYEFRFTPDGEPEKILSGRWPLQTDKDGKYVLVSLPAQMLEQGGNNVQLFGITANETVPAERYFVQAQWLAEEKSEGGEKK